jgi:hypothetical protein
MKKAKKGVGDKQESLTYVNASHLSPTPFVFAFVFVAASRWWSGESTKAVKLRARLIAI